MYVAFQTEEALQSLGEETPEIYWFPNEWNYSDSKLPTSFSKELYDNLVAIVESNDAIDLLQPSPDKWSFALSFIEAIGEVIAGLPESLFREHGYSKNDILFLTTMSDGDYIDEMMIESVKKYNNSRIAKELLNALEN